MRAGGWVHACVRAVCGGGGGGGGGGGPACVRAVCVRVCVTGQETGLKKAGGPVSRK